MRCRRPLILASVPAVAAFSLLAAGCGGGGSAGVASVASSTTVATTTNPQNGLVAFSGCMRSHGMPNFPDPQRVGGRSLKLTIHRLEASNSQFPAAQRACNHLLPNGGSESREPAQQNRTLLADMRSFARCMRGHGLTRFPDPSARSGLSVEMVQAQGIDVHSPAVLRVVQACLPASHGALTPAMVRKALNNARG
jgi:hypothetical protein